MAVWEQVNHDDADLRDRTYLASLIMMSERSTELFEDLVQVFFERDVCDLSHVKLLTESSLLDLFAHPSFNVSRVRLNGCVNLSARFVHFLAGERHFLTEILLASTMVDDTAVRFLCKNCLHLECVDLSNCVNVHDACVRYLAALPNLCRCYLRGCDLSDRPLLECVAVEQTFPRLQMLDVSMVNRITFTACHTVQVWVKRQVGLLLLLLL
jgi:hypothetical protein